jgi:aminoglycoside phosphotransferase (APT) family kinase protein
VANPEALDDVAEQLGLTVSHRLPGGEFGAYWAMAEDGCPVVLKLTWHTEPELQTAAELTESLRRDGYPVPRFRAWGEIDGQRYTLQDAIDGEVPDRLTLAHVHTLVELWRLHEGAAGRVGRSDASWVDRMAHEFSESTRLAELTDDARVHDVVGHCQQLTHRLDPADFRIDDVHHGDFHHRNVLARGENVVAVFDWEAATPADSRADLLRLWTCPTASGQIEPAASRYLHAAVEETIADDVREPLVLRRALLDLDFALRTRPEALEWALDVAYIGLGFRP